MTSPETTKSRPVQPLPWRAIPWHIVEGNPQIRDANDDLVCEVASDETARFICEVANAQA